MKSGAWEEGATQSARPRTSRLSAKGILDSRYSALQGGRKPKSCFIDQEQFYPERTCNSLSHAVIFFLCYLQRKIDGAKVYITDDVTREAWTLRRGPVRDRLCLSGLGQEKGLPSLRVNVSGREPGEGFLDHMVTLFLIF